MIVTDASAIIEWLIGGPRGHAVEEALEGEDIHAPAHLDVEVAQVTRRLALHAVITPARGKAMLELLAEMPIRRVPVAPLLPRIWSLRKNLTAYDAAYVALAEALPAPLLTFDQKIPSAPGHRAEVVVPS
jgi:predicted nucleic acid-binding protein